MLVLILFYAFATVLTAAALGVILTRNPVHSALCLVLCFFTSAAIWLLIEAEFLAIVLVLVYVGAVMVLFLFVVMMLDVDFAELRAGFMKHAPLGALIGLILLAELVMVVGFMVVRPGTLAKAATPIPTAGSGITNTEALGRVLYTKYVYYFQGAGLILLDNFSVADMAEAVRRTAGLAKLEASGGLRIDDAAAVAATGVDYLAVGALTHSAPALDIGLDLVGASVVPHGHAGSGR